VERIDRRAPGARDFGWRFWDGSEVPPPPTADDELTLVVRDPVALAYALRQPNELGFGRAWVTGALDVDGDLERGLALRDRFGGLRLSAADRLAALRAVARLGGVRLRGPAVPASEAPVGRGRRHSLDRDRVAVRHHYDVSNAFYRMVLGPTMVYSCAYFSSPDDTLEVAQTRKLETICRKLRLRAGDRLLDIGCGWGTLVLHAAREHGARAVGVTLSEPQAELARARVREAGLDGRVSIRVQDYRDLAGERFDAIASIGMVEHVGGERIDLYARQLAGMLRPGGRLLNHGIARLYEAAGGAFTMRYVFPDSDPLALSRVLLALERAGFTTEHVEEFGPDYVETLRHWARRLDAHRAEAVALAGEERVRVWRLYLRGARRNFESGFISIYQAQCRLARV